MNTVPMFEKVLSADMLLSLKGKTLRPQINFLIWFGNPDKLRQILEKLIFM